MLRIAHGARCQRSPVAGATRWLYGVRPLRNSRVPVPVGEDRVIQVYVNTDDALKERGQFEA